jgi:hypothetical protein
LHRDRAIDTNSQLNETGNNFGGTGNLGAKTASTLLLTQAAMTEITEVNKECNPEPEMAM